MTKEELWQAVLAQIQFNISPANFATWFKNTKILVKKERQLVISVPNNFSKEWLENKYDKLILKILRGLDEEIREIKYEVAKAALKVKDPVFQIDPYQTDGQLEFQELKINKNTNLNPRYSFTNFIVGPFNELPHAAIMAITKDPGKNYNPLFVYGGVGLGKTHLIQAAGNEINNIFPKKKIKYIPSEKFISGVVNSIRSHEIENFKEEYKKLDVLIIDDVQFLAGKEKTQEEFFHIFNTLYEKNKQMIISSDRPPKSLPSIVERLKSRFEGGMIADIGIPDTETRIAILKVKSKEKGLNLNNEILNYIADNIKNNIRELEGALNRLYAYQKFNNKDIDLITTKKILKNVVLAPIKPVTVKEVIQTVADFYDLKEKDIFIATRRREIVKPRQVAMYLLRSMLNCSFPFIGRKFKGKDHTTTIHAYWKITKEIEKDEVFSEEINLIKQRLCS